MSRHHEPNASYFSARYAERKRAGERARDSSGRVTAPCSRPGCGVLIETDHICALCRAEYEGLREAGLYAEADAFALGHRRSAVSRG